MNGFGMSSLRPLLSCWLGALDQTLAAVARLGRVKGFFVDRVDPRTGVPLTTSPDDGKPIRPLVSAVDNGWLAAALIMVRNTRPELRERADELLRAFEGARLNHEVHPAVEQSEVVGREGEPYAA